ncbi:conserved hypothetical protein [Vibrio chagasii]|nr:conserved hypothetical protein [Vibrio chagasii]
MNLLIVTPKELSNFAALAALLNHNLKFKKPDTIYCRFHAGEIESILNQKVLPDTESTIITHCIEIINTNSNEIPPVASEKLTAHKVYYTPLITLKNLKRGENFDLYIGRGTIFGNPYSRADGFSKSECIHNHKYDFEFNLLHKVHEIKSKLDTLTVEKLGCHCSPSPCHGDTYIRYANRLKPIYKTPPKNYF